MGVILGGCVFGGIAATFSGHPPLKSMLDLCDKIKLWAVIVALGGTLPSFKILEVGVFNGDIRGLLKQVFYILSALSGAQMGYRIIYYLGGVNKL